MNEDIEVLKTSKVSDDDWEKESHFEDEWIPAESVKFAKNGSVYANFGNYYECGLYYPKWFKTGKWRHIVFVDQV